MTRVRADLLGKRTTRLPGRADDDGSDLHLETYERRALPLRCKYLGELCGFFVTRIGPPSRMVHLSQYEDLADRERRDGGRSEWQAYRRIASAEDTLVDMENQILKPMRFFVPR